MVTEQVTNDKKNTLSFDRSRTRRKIVREQIHSRPLTFRLCHVGTRKILHVRAIITLSLRKTGEKKVTAIGETTMSSSKWNESLVTSFLKAYKRYPCLWNPYHQDYYDCRAKNEALRRIINDLGTPGFTVTDYLHRIETIREMYKREQTRTIEGLQSQKRYTSPLPWYHLVADMLTKVISDEEKANSRTISKAVRNVTSTTIFVPRCSGNDRLGNRRRKEMRWFGPETQLGRIRACDDELASRHKATKMSVRSSGKRKAPRPAVDDQSRTRYVICPAFRTSGNVSKNREEDVLSNSKQSTSLSNSDSGINDFADREGRPLLRCPLCGCSNAKYREIEEGNMETAAIEITDSVPSTEHIGDPSPPFVKCDGCKRREDAPGQPKRYADQDEHLEISQEPTKEVPCPGVRPSREQTPSSFVGSDPRRDANMLNETKEAASHTQIVRFDPAMTTKFHHGTIEARTRLKIVLSNGDSAEKFSRSSQTDRNAAKSCESKGFCTQSDLPDGKTTEANVDATSHVDRGTVRGAIHEAAARQSVSLQTDRVDEHEKSKEAGVNVVELATKGIQSTVCVSRGDSVRCFEKETGEAATTVSAHQDHGLLFEEGESLPSQTKSFECVRPIALKASDKESQVEPGDGVTSPRESPDQDAVVALQHLVRKVFASQPAAKSSSTTSLKPRNDQYECRVRGSCTVDVTDMIRGIKELAAKTFGSNVPNASCKQLKEFCVRSKEENKYSRETEEERSPVEAETSKRVDTVNGSTTDQEHAHRGIPADTVDEDTALRDKVSLVDRGVTTNLGSHEVRTSSSYSRLPVALNEVAVQSSSSSRVPVVLNEVAVQSSSSSREPVLNDVAVQSSSSARVPVLNEVATQSNSPSFIGDSPSSNERKKICVGTQKRDPILVRVIKCCEKQAIVKSDKGTFTVKSNGEPAKKRIDKDVETCGRPTCRPYPVSKKSNAENERRRDYAESNDPKRYVNYTCDETCKNKELCDAFDWTDVRNVDALYNFNKYKIPVCLKPRKCTYINKQVAESYVN